MAFSTSPFDVSPAAATPWFKSKVRILAILGHSDGIDTERDRALLKQLPNADIAFLVEESRKEISDRLWEQAWDIIFFAGHSKTEGETGRIYINPTESLTIDELWYALKKAVERGLQLAIFNSCDGLGLAQKLDDLQIPQMIVMRELVPDRVAQEFLKYFLTAFALGTPLSLAVRDARERLQGLEGQFPCASWLPVVYQNPAEEPLTWREMQRGRRSQERPQVLQRWKPKIGAAALLLGLVGGGWQWGKPHLARWANNSGYQQYQNGEWGSALANWKRTQKIDPDHPVAYYSQAIVCDRARDLDCARTNYQKAAQRGLPAAYSRLARLHILEEQNYQIAAQLAWQGLDLLTEEDGDIVKASLLTYLGWARWGTKRLPDAQKHLRESLILDRDRAVTYCLLAQVLQDQDQIAEALEYWQFCHHRAQPDEPDDDFWIERARQQLQPR